VSGDLPAPPQARRRRIALLGGSFDPPHNAHVALAHAALDHLQLDELRWMPAGDPWQKHGDVTPAAHRVAMVQRAIEGEPRFVLERCELRRSGPTYTVDTVRELEAAEPADWLLIIGQDQYANLHTWHAWPELLRRVTLAVASRAGQPPTPSDDVAAQAHRVVALPLPRIDVSASEVRQRVREGRDYDGMVPTAVARYIEENRLYRGNPRS
jgi:nicotinate-nucleotide adenylyltransferase